MTLRVEIHMIVRTPGKTTPLEVLILRAGYALKYDCVHVKRPELFTFSSL